MARAIVKRLATIIALSALIGGTLVACDEGQQKSTSDDEHCQMIPIISRKVMVWTEICT